MPLPNPKNLQDFSVLEKEALKEISMDIIKSDLQKSLKEMHQKSMKDVTSQISTIEVRCVKEVQETLERQLKHQLEVHFQKLLQSYQADISKLLSPLIKRAEEDVSRLNKAVTKTDGTCQKIESQYALRWSRPFFALVFSSALAGALIGFILLLLQVPFLSVLLMNAHTREAYETGAHMIKLRKELDAQSMRQTLPQPIPESTSQATPPEAKPPKAQKTPAMLKLNKKKKTTK